MYGFKKYIDKNGLIINATPKAYELFYKNQGFEPLLEEKAVKQDTATDTFKDADANPDGAETNTDTSDKSAAADTEKHFEDMSMAELKSYLDNRGISYGKKVTKAELVKLADAEEK